MAKKFLVGINLNRNELQNAVIQPLASAPSSPVAGLVYFDTTLDKFGVYDGTQWVYMGDFDGSNYVDLTTNQTVGGIKTFSAFPVTPSSAPTSDYQVANKKYADTKVQGPVLTAGGRLPIYTDSSGTSLTQDDRYFLSTTDTLYLNIPAINTDRIVGLLDPTDAQDAATKQYVDDAITASGGYTDEDAQDAVGEILTDTATVDFDYDDVANTIEANVLDSPLLDGENAAYYKDRANHTGTQSADTLVDGTTNKVFTNAHKGKLDNILISQEVDLDLLESRVNSLDTAVVLMGAWDASTGIFPVGGNAQAGYSFIVSVPGVVDGVSFNVNDRLLAIADNASTSVYSGNWLKLDYTDQVLSVNTQTGAVVLDADDIDDTSTTNKFVTAADITKLGNLSGTNTGDEPDATTTVKGIVELATDAEAKAKASTSVVVTPSNLADFARKYTGTIGNGSATSIAVTHGLGSQFVTAQAFDASTNELIECDITLTSSTQTTFGFSVAPASNAIRVVITG